MHTRQQTRGKQQRGQWTLVGLLVSMAIIAILSAWYYAKILKPQAGSHNGTARRRAAGLRRGVQRVPVADHPGRDHVQSGS